MRLGGVGVLVALWFLAGAAPALAQPGDAAAGKTVYERKCAGCHGEKGDGKGPAAELLAPKPRDFTAGLYKIRSTANKVPTDQDLLRIITDDGHKRPIQRKARQLLDGLEPQPAGHLVRAK